MDILYLSGVNNALLQSAALVWRVGLLITPATSNYRQYLKQYPTWSMDNGCFTNPNITTAELIKWALTLPKGGLFLPAPDVVGNAKATLARAGALREIKAAGFHPAYVAQDGSERIPPPWDDLDCLFIGGSTAWKLSEMARLLVAEAKRRGKWVHMGRVNSFRRLALAARWGCDSADGTYLRFTGPAGVRSITNWLEKVEKIK